MNKDNEKPPGSINLYEKKRQRQKEIAAKKEKQDYPIINQKGISNAAILLEALNVQNKLQQDNRQRQKTINKKLEENKRKYSENFNIIQKKRQQFKVQMQHQQMIMINQLLEKKIFKEHHQFESQLKKQFADLQNIHQKQALNKRNIESYRIRLQQILQNQSKTGEQKEKKQIAYQQIRQIKGDKAYQSIMMRKRQQSIKEKEEEHQLIGILQKQLGPLKYINAQLKKRYDSIQQKINNHFVILSNNHQQLEMNTQHMKQNYNIINDAAILLKALNLQNELQQNNTKRSEIINKQLAENKRKYSGKIPIIRMRIRQLQKEYSYKQMIEYKQMIVIKKLLQKIPEQDKQFEIWLQNQFSDIKKIRQRQVSNKRSIQSYRIKLQQILKQQSSNVEQQKHRQFIHQPIRHREDSQLQMPRLNKVQSRETIMIKQGGNQVIGILQKQLASLKQINAQLKEKYDLIEQKIRDHFQILFELERNMNQLERYSQKRRQRQNQIIIKVQQIEKMTQLSHIQLNNLQILSISNKSSLATSFMTPKQAKILSEIPLPNLKELQLQNNYILDEGLQHLAKAQYPQLEKINLNDNKITIKGLNHLYQNSWPIFMKYQLDSVQLLNGGYQLKVSQYINTIKTIKSIEAKQFDKIYLNNEEDHIISALNLLMITPNEDQQKKLHQSEQILNQQKKKALSNQKSIAMVIVKLKQQFKDRLILQQHSSLKSKISSNILFTGSNNKRIRITQTFKNNFSSGFSFQKFQHNSSQINRFIEWFYDRNLKQFGLKKQNIIVHSITEGSIKLDFSLNCKDIAALPQSYKKKLQFSSFFKEFYLTEDVFDSRGDYNFPKNTQSAEVQQRGGYPYYQPIFGTGFGIKVMDLYQDNNWLAMNGNPQEWAITFHGVNNPAYRLASGNSIFQSILQGREKGEMLIPGGGQGYTGDKCRRTKQSVGNGIYTSPYFLTSLFGYAGSKAGDYHLVLQCRAKPDKIKFTTREDYWVINNPKDLRPYRIILFSEEERRNLMKISRCQVEAHKKIYKTQFNYSNWTKKRS